MKRQTLNRMKEYHELPCRHGGGDWYPDRMVLRLLEERRRLLQVCKTIVDNTTFDGMYDETQAAISYADEEVDEA